MEPNVERGRFTLSSFPNGNESAVTEGATAEFPLASRIANDPPPRAPLCRADRSGPLADSGRVYRDEF